ncbi:Hypothetical protein ERS031536_03524 [Mycobacterium tuberculosis]|nr:Hypothetical protein ERS031536_03524 [Mycobacterium tuberculosis]
MTIGVDLSTDLQDWIRLSGMNMIQGSETNDGRTILWNKGGEVRYFIDRLPDGMLLRHPIA